LSSTLSVITSASLTPMPLSLSASSLVFGESTEKLSTTHSRPSRASCDRIAASPARYTLRLTFWPKFSSGLFGKIFPPPRHNGLEARPARARPVPFWRHGFLLDLLISLRPFWARVPSRAFAM
jgi:hypothetical protein